MTTAEPAARPRNPWIGAGFAVGFLLAAVLTTVALVAEFDRVLAWDISGQRSEGFLLLGPFLFGALGIVTLVRAVRAVGPWRRYVAATDAASRRRALAAARRNGPPSALLAVVGVLALGGAATLLAVALSESVRGVGAVLLADFVLLLGMLAAAVLGYLAQRVWSRAGG